MDYGVLHLNLISANDLNNANIFSKMDVYAIVSAKAPPSTRAPARTPAGTTPTSPSPAVVLHLLLSQLSLGDLDIAQVRVSVSELLDSAPADRKACPSFVSYQVRKPKGVLNFSYQFSGDLVAVPGKGDEPVTAYPASPSARQHYRQPQQYVYPPPHAGCGYGTGHRPPRHPYRYEGTVFQPDDPAGYGNLGIAGRCQWRAPNRGHNDLISWQDDANM